jgi:hypothetical protein
VCLNSEVSAHRARYTIVLKAHVGGKSILGVPVLSEHGIRLNRFVNGIDCGRNHLRKDNAFFSFDLALDRPFHLGERMRIIPKLEIFNLFNDKNNINPLSAPAPVRLQRFPTSHRLD